MSILTKVFVILNLLVAAVFFAVVANLYAMRIDWPNKLHKEANEHYLTYKTKTAEIETWNVAFKNIRDQYNIERDKVTKFEGALQAKDEIISNQEREINTLQGRLDFLQQEIDRIITLETVMTRQITELQTKVEEYKRNLELAQGRYQNAQQAFLYAKQDVDNFSKQLAALEREHVTVTRETKKLKEVLAEVERRGTRLPQMGTKALSGKVMSSSEELKICVLSIGEKDGVQVGQEFAISRGDKYIATVVIDRVDETFSVARVLFQKESVAVNDDARNK
ncbi:MAG: hypothetical protein A2W23_00535 [Planctomycetes bacterium RBG_16_43_13]|nr:MAG: hypothetical protein A2W23_00535 [Planctomycetes bacterium RBG_16_43_13]